MVRRIVIAFVGMVLIAAAIYAGFFFFGGRERTIESILRRYQFTELIPPSTLAPPGTVVRVIQDDPLTIGVVCPSSEALGDHLDAKLLASDSSSSKEAEELTGDFSLSGSAQQQLTAGTDSKYVKKIAVTLSNVKLMEVPDSVVFQLIAERKDSCTKAIEFRQKQGQKITMIKSVIQASVLYRIDFEGGIDATARMQILQRIAGGMGLKVAERAQDTMEGDGLYWGVRDDESLAQISLNHPPATGAAKHPQALPVNRFAMLMSR